ncbi:MAG: hypothetical protein ACRDLK_00040, partial [Gaiellaceae bacterium]
AASGRSAARLTTPIRVARALERVLRATRAPRSPDDRLTPNMPSYLVETYLNRASAGERVACEERASSAAEELTREQTSVRFERSIHIPEDEICFFVFQAATSGDAALVAERAGLHPIRIVEAVSS